MKRSRDQISLSPSSHPSSSSPTNNNNNNNTPIKPLSQISSHNLNQWLHHSPTDQIETVRQVKRKKRLASSLSLHGQLYWDELIMLYHSESDVEFSKRYRSTVQFWRRLKDESIDYLDQVRGEMLKIAGSNLSSLTRETNRFYQQHALQVNYKVNHNKSSHIVVVGFGDDDDDRDGNESHDDFDMSVRNGSSGISGSSGGCLLFNDPKEELYAQFLAMFGYSRSLDVPDSDLTTRLIEQLKLSIGGSGRGSAVTATMMLTEDVSVWAAKLKNHERNLLTLFYCLRGAEGIENEDGMELARDDTLMALKLRDKCAIAFNNLGLIYEQEGDPKKALNYLMRAVSIDVNYADCYYNLSVTHFYAGRAVLGLKDAIHACSLDSLDEPNIDHYTTVRARLWNKSRDPLADRVLTR